MYVPSLLRPLSPFLKYILLTRMILQNHRRICPQNPLHLRSLLRFKLGPSNWLPQPLSMVLPRLLCRHDHPPCHPRHSEVQSQVRGLMGRIYSPRPIPVYPWRHLDTTLSSIIPRRCGVIINLLCKLKSTSISLHGSFRWFSGHLKEKNFPWGLDKLPFIFIGVGGFSVCSFLSIPTNRAS